MNNIESSTSDTHMVILEIVKDLKTDVRDLKAGQESFKDEIRQDIRSINNAIVTLSGAIVQKQTTQSRKNIAVIGIVGTLLSVVTSLALYIVHII